jgi:2'-5' RNA ligase
LPHKVFFAIRPPADEATAISLLAATVGSHHNGVPLRADNLHLSLNGVGQYTTVPPDDIARAITAAATVGIAPFEIVFDRFLTWDRERKRPTVMRCITGEPELKALYAAIYAAMLRGGLLAEEDPGTPHMTLFYSTAVLAEQHLPQPFAWRVDRFCLIHSIHGTGRHELVGEWLLRGTQAKNAPSTTDLRF